MDGVTKLNIYTIGDSHAKYGWNRVNELDIKVIITHLGPVLAHSIMKDWRSRIQIRPNRFSRDSLVIFHFGEIDCRCHIGKRPNPAAALQQLVPGYLSAIAQASEILEGRVAVSTVPPPPAQINTPDPVQFPVSGSSLQRSHFANTFNKLISAYAPQNGLEIFDSSFFVTDNDGYMNAEYSSDGVHIDDPSILVLALKENFKLM